MQQELYLLEFLLGHVTYISPEEQRKTLPLLSPKLEEIISKLCCEKQRLWI